MSNVTPYKLSELATNEMLDFAKYVNEDRAIPNMIDGCKPSQRFYLYSSLQNGTIYKKVSAVAGITSDFGYNHGETSVAAAGQLMAATWRNNVCLVEGRGSFGTRQVQEAGAPRYVYTRVSDNFKKYVKDLELSPVHMDPEHEPPAFYLPIIPLVAINGATGIASGFATNILPRSEMAVIEAIAEYLQNGKIATEIPVSFPDFNGTVVYDAASDRHICKGKWRKVGKTTLHIEEIPYGFDREKYVAVLDKLEDDGEIVGYEDQTGSNGFRFQVTLKQKTSATWSPAQIEKKFKLAKTYAENITVIGPNRDLREYDRIEDLIVDFINFRMGILSDRIALRKVEFAELLRWLKVKIQFIEAVLNDQIVFKGRGRADVEKQILALTDAEDGDLRRLLALSIASLTRELVTELKREITQAKKDLAYWKKTTESEQFLDDIAELL